MLHGDALRACQSRNACSMHYLKVYTIIKNNHENKVVCTQIVAIIWGNMIHIYILSHGHFKEIIHVRGYIAKSVIYL